MKQYVQEHNECQLTTLASLADVDYQEVREAALKVTNGVPWGETKDRLPNYLTVARQFLPKDQVERLVNAAYREFRWVDDGYGGEKKRTVTIKGKHLDRPLPGRGVVIIDRLGRKGSHIMPYEDGTVYDSDEEQTCGSLRSMAVHLNQRDGWSVVKVVRVDKDEPTSYRDLPCPKCGALPNLPCRLPSGHIHYNDHKERRDLHA